LTLQLSDKQRPMLLEYTNASFERIDQRLRRPWGLAHVPRVVDEYALATDDVPFGLGEMLPFLGVIHRPVPAIRKLPTGMSPTLSSVHLWGPTANVRRPVPEWNCRTSGELGVGPGPTYFLKPRGGIMKKRVKRTKTKSASKRARAKSKTKKTTKAKTPAKAKKTLLPKVKRVAKKAALAAGVAAIGTALSELQPEQKNAPQDASDQSESKRGNRR
jgi:hypothetical protein